MACISAMPMPSARPPWIWPSTIIGLMRGPSRHGDEAPHRDLAGARVDVHDADVGPERVGQVGRVVDVWRRGGPRRPRAAPGGVCASSAISWMVLPCVWSPGRSSGHAPTRGRRTSPRGRPRRRSALSRTPGRPPPRPRPTPASSGSRRCPGRTGSGRCRRGPPRCPRAGCRARWPRSGRTWSRGPGPGSAREAHDGLAGRVDPQLAAVGHAQAEDVHVLARPGADALGEEAERRCP